MEKNKLIFERIKFFILFSLLISFLLFLIYSIIKEENNKPVIYKWINNQITDNNFKDKNKTKVELTKNTKKNEELNKINDNLKQKNSKKENNRKELIEEVEELYNVPEQQDKKLKTICTINTKLEVIKWECINKKVEKSIRKIIKDLINNENNKKYNIKYKRFIIKYDKDDNLLLINPILKNDKIIKLNRLWYFVDEKAGKVLPRLNTARMLTEWELNLFGGVSLKKYYILLKNKELSKKDITNYKFNENIITKFFRAYRFYFGDTDDFKIKLISNLVVSNIWKYTITCWKYTKNYDNKLIAGNYNFCILWKNLKNKKYKFIDLIQF